MPGPSLVCCLLYRGLDRRSRHSTATTPVGKDDQQQHFLISLVTSKLSPLFLLPGDYGRGREGWRQAESYVV